MGVEGTDAVGCVQVILFLFAGHDVDGSPHGVAPQVRGHDSLIDLDALDGTYRQVGEGGALALDVQGYFVDEIADGVSRHAVQREVGVRTQAAFQAEAHACRAVDQRAQVGGAAGGGADVKGADLVRALAQLSRLAFAAHGRFLEADGVCPQHKVQPLLPAAFHGACGWQVAHQRGGEDVPAGREAQLVIPLRVGACPQCGLAHPDGGEG